MRNIVVVECASTGTNFIQDIVNRGYNPIVLELKVPDTEDGEIYNSMVHSGYKTIKVDFEVINEKDTYEETLEMVREYDPLLVIPGSEKGVILATKLANDLNLKCNPIENLDSFTLKDKMQEKIAEKGLRHIRGKVVHSIEEAIDYYDEQNFEEVVVKPTYSAGSVGVRICLNKEEMINSLRELFNDSNLYGEELSEFVIQERINGEEYFVNTVSCEGTHRVTLIWKYNKIKTAEGGHVYDSIMTVNELGLGEAEMVEYAYDVADALGIRYGAVHGEYMIDDKGPVLIEVNCRPSGGGMDADYINKISGQHETDSILDSYLNPDNFYYELHKGYNLLAHGALKLFIVPKDLIAESSPMTYISNKLKSHYKTSQEVIDTPKLFVKTQDFETTGGTVFMIHEDGYTLQKDLDFLRDIEKYAFSLVLSDESEKKTEVDENETYDGVKTILKMVQTYSSTLFVTDHFFDDVDAFQISLDKVDEVHGDFKCVVVNLNKSIIGKKDDIIAYEFLKIINKVRPGGIIIIPETTYKYTPHGRVGAEALIKVLDLKLELPLHNLNRAVIASRIN